MNLENFLNEIDENRVSLEIRNRIRLATAAYAYEYLDNPIMTDGDFDTLAKKIDLSINTNRPDLDKWFKENFSTDTGMWIRYHPEKNKLDFLAKAIINKKWHR